MLLTVTRTGGACIPKLSLRRPRFARHGFKVP